MLHDPWVILAILVATALIGATISGMLGMAGGMFLLGVMSNVGLALDVIIPVHGVVQLVSNSTRVVAFLNNVRWRPFVIVFFVAAPLPVVGMWLRTQLSEGVTLALIGLIILYATWGPRFRARQMPEWLAFTIVGVLCGAFGVVFGATGPMVAPFVIRKGWKKEEMIATSALCQAYGHVLKLVAFGFAGFDFSEYLHLIAPMCAAVVVGTYIGRWLLGRLPEHWFIIIYKTLIALLALRLIAMYWWS